jgi:gluconokinase
VTFLYLEGTHEVLSERMKHRDGHFMPVALLDSQLATLEPPGEDEETVKASIDQAPDQVVAELLEGIRRKQQ